jgi:hypothetical protein
MALSIAYIASSTVAGREPDDMLLQYQPACKKAMLDLILDIAISTSKQHRSKQQRSRRATGSEAAGKHATTSRLQWPAPIACPRSHALGIGHGSLSPPQTCTLDDSGLFVITSYPPTSPLTTPQTAQDCSPLSSASSQLELHIHIFLLLFYHS